MSELKQAHPPFSDRDLERYLVGELDDAQRARIEAAARNDPALAAHLEERRAEKRAFDQLHPTPDFLKAGAGSKRPSALRRWLPQALVFATAAAALALFLVPTPEPEIRARGVADATVDVVVKRGDRIFTLEGARVLLRAGDALRVDVESPSAATVLVGLLSGDKGSLLLEERMGAGKWSQPSSFVLDDAAGPEILAVALATTADEADRARAAIALGQPPDGARLFRWEKEPLP